MTDPVSLKVLRWNVAGLSEDSTDISLSQISTLTDLEVLLLQECFRKLDGVNVGAHELFTPSEVVGVTAMPTSHHQSEMERTRESCWESEQMDCGRVRWTVDYHFSPFASQREEVWRFPVGFDGNPGFHQKETGTTPDPGWRLQCELLWIDRLSPRGRVDAETENNDGHKRFLARTIFRYTLLWQSWMYAGSEQELYTRCSWKDPGDAQTQMDFIMTTRKLEARRVQMLDSDWFKTDHRAVLKAMMRYSAKPVVNLCGPKPDDSWQIAATETLPLLVETAKAQTEIQDFIRRRLGQHLILVGDFNVSFYGLTDFRHVGGSMPRPRTMTDTNDSLRARAFGTHCCGRAGCTQAPNRNCTHDAAGRILETRRH